MPAEGVNAAENLRAAKKREAEKLLTGVKDWWNKLKNKNKKELENKNKKEQENKNKTNEQLHNLVNGKIEIMGHIFESGGYYRHKTMDAINQVTKNRIRILEFAEETEKGFYEYLRDILDGKNLRPIMPQEYMNWPSIYYDLGIKENLKKLEKRERQREESCCSVQGGKRKLYKKSKKIRKNKSRNTRSRSKKN